jgi:hypothetical protein
MMLSATTVLVAVPHRQVDHYQAYFADHEDFVIQVATDLAAVRQALANQDVHIDGLVIDNRLGDVYSLIDDLRHTYPRLLIVLVDEEADFGIPGQADAISTDPFAGDNLVKQIKQLLSERRVETLRSDSLPAVRVFAKHLREATGLLGKQQAAVDACLEMGYDYVAYYQLAPADDGMVTLRAQAGAAAIQAIAPKESGADDLMTWVARSGQSRIAGPDDHPTHPLVARGRLGAVACVPVTFSQNMFGVLVACQDVPDSITNENVLMLELISSQLASAILKERR